MLRHDKVAMTLLPRSKGSIAMAIVASLRFDGGRLELLEALKINRRDINSLRQNFI